MSAHGCVICGECGAACPMCGTCACPKDRPFTYFQQPVEKVPDSLRTTIEQRIAVLEMEQELSHDGSFGAWMKRIDNEHTITALEWVLEQL